MHPVGTRFRQNGEQVTVHQCLGCQTERRCRAAADDSYVAWFRLEPIRDGIDTLTISNDELTA
ncbi:hypothetical protein BH23CHL5_BH23CHL5_22420 [soil metagenome]